jgi:acetoin utilization protein AcuB
MNPEVGKVMTRGLITIGIDAAMAEAYEKMRRYGIRHLPVTDEAGDLIGLLSDRDVQRAMINKRNERVLIEHTFEFDPRHTVKDFMSFPLCTVQPHFSIARVAQMMVDEKKSAFVVVSRERGVQPKQALSQRR